MTTTEERTAVEIQPAAWEAAPYIQWGIPGVPFSAVRVPLSTDPKQGALWIDLALRASRYLAMKYDQTFPGAAQQPPDDRQRLQQARGGQQRQYGERETRATKYPVVAGMKCDICNGPVGRYPRTGNMTSDKAVCLGKCKDDRFVHTVAWLDNELPDDGRGDIDPDNLPF